MSPLPTIPSLPPSLFFLSSRVHAHRIPFRPSIRKITYGLGGKEREGKGKNEKEGEKKKGEGDVRRPVSPRLGRVSNTSSLNYIIEWLDHATEKKKERKEFLLLSAGLCLSSRRLASSIPLAAGACSERGGRQLFHWTLHKVVKKCVSPEASRKGGREEGGGAPGHHYPDRPHITKQTLGRRRRTDP